MRGEWSVTSLSCVFSFGKIAYFDELQFVAHVAVLITQFLDHIGQMVESALNAFEFFRLLLVLHPSVLKRSIDLLFSFDQVVKVLIEFIRHPLGVFPEGRHQVIDQGAVFLAGIDVLAPVFGARLDGELQLAAHALALQNPVFQLGLALDHLALFIDLVLPFLLNHFIHVFVFIVVEDLPHVHVRVALFIDLGLVIVLTVIFEARSLGKVEIFLFKHLVTQFIKYIADIFATPLITKGTPLSLIGEISK